MIKIGNCGWAYLNANQYFENWEEKFSSKLQAYAKLFGLVEINYTFYRIPKLGTAQKWREEADSVNPKFEFTIKVSQIITHRDKFSSSKSFWAYNKMLEIARALRADVLLFQSAESFKPTKENLENAKNFFRRIKRDGLNIVWEVRWEKDWTSKIVKPLFKELKINQCVDPLRQDCFHSGEIVYYRLHGFGSPMYSYGFSKEELEKLRGIIKKQKKPVYVLFNNSACYEDALTLKKLM